MPPLSQIMQDAAILRLLRNAGVLAGGNAAAAAVAIASMALTARALGPEFFGTLILITTYVRVVDQLVNFQVWQPLIKFGSDIQETGRPAEFAALIKLGAICDVTSAAAGMVVSILLAFIVAPLFTWDTTAVWMAAAFSLTILFNFVSTPTAVLRIYNKFGLLSGQVFVASLVKLIAVIVAVLTGAGLWGFIVAWGVSAILGQLYLIFLGWRETRKQQIRGIISTPLSGVRRNFPGFWQFLFATHASSSVRLGTTELDTLVVGGLLGPIAAGTYRIVKDFARVLTLITMPLYQAVYPDLAREWAKGNVHAFERIVSRTIYLAGALALLMFAGYALLGRTAIAWTVGPDYLHAFVPLLVYVCGALIAAATFSFQPAMLAMGLPTKSLAILFGATVLYLACLVAFSLEFDLLGAASAYVVFYVVWALLMYASIRVRLTESVPKFMESPSE